LVAAPMLSLAAERSSRAGLFQHSVASGDPLADRVILWTRVTPATPVSVLVVSYVVATDPGLTQVVLNGTTKTNPSRDYTVKVDPAGLNPATTYYYRFFCGGEASPVGRTRTLPTGSAQRLRIGVASCSNHAYGYFNAYRRMAERADLDMVLHLGDYLYEYGPNQYGSVRTPEPPNEMVVLSDYRLRHAQYKRDADLQELHRQHPVIAIWDDHEITNDAWVDGAQNHTEGAEGSWPERVNQGLQAYYEWMPVRIPDATKRRQNQRAFRCGDLLELVMLEERLSARSQQLPATIPVPGLGTGFIQTGEFANPQRTLLGAEQEAWLADRLRTTPARWKFLGQGVMFAQLKLQAAPLSAGGGLFVNSDQWDGYQPARNRVYDVLKGGAGTPAVDNVVVLTGDIHSSWAADLTQDPNNPNVASGGYNASTGEGSRAVEFVGTSITSPGLDDPNGTTAAFLRSVNPHFKYIDLNQRGYLLLDVTPQRVVGEFWFVDTVATLSNNQTFGAAFEVMQGSNRLQPSAQTTPPANPPALAP
ncbi:MAG: alkaline phosphatase D family protein, partial [Chitinophagaceae bacterium]|nr:alkaline phosphatase D family protein [Rubrivivax sp.]